jgi:deoxyribose-phosphate aldolase
MTSSPEPELAQAIEHTLLRATATPEDIDALCVEALRHRFYGVCVNPVYVARAVNRLGSSGVAVVSVAGFPLGASTPACIAHEAVAAVTAGAREIDMVAPIGLARAGDMCGVEAAVRAVKTAIGSAVLKVILETGYFETEATRALARAVLAGGADFLKTSTGFGPRGATREDVELLVGEAGGGARVKASGGIKTQDFARLLLRAGASRLGTSSGVALVSESLET